MKRTAPDPAAAYDVWQSKHLTPPEGAMTVAEIVSWANHVRLLRVMGEPAPSGWQDWLRRRRDGR